MTSLSHQRSLEETTLLLCLLNQTKVSMVRKKKGATLDLLLRFVCWKRDGDDIWRCGLNQESLLTGTMAQAATWRSSSGHT